MPAICPICHRAVYSLDRMHVKTRGSGAGWLEWEFIRGCRDCHMKQGHLGWYRFCQKFPHVLGILHDKGWEIVEEFGVKKVRRVVE